MFRPLSQRFRTIFFVLLHGIILNIIFGLLRPLFIFVTFDSRGCDLDSRRPLSSRASCCCHMAVPILFFCAKPSTTKFFVFGWGRCTPDLPVFGWGGALAPLEWASLAFDRSGQTEPPQSNALFFGTADEPQNDPQSPPHGHRPSLSTAPHIFEGNPSQQQQTHRSCPYELRLRRRALSPLRQ